MADWEFDGSVNFAPKHYRQQKYRECEQLGKQINDELSAVKYLKAFEYIEYLADNHMSEINNYHKLVGYQEMALSMLTSDKYIYEWIKYPVLQQMWKGEFDYLRSIEKEVGKSINLSTYVDKIIKFNEITDDFNKQNKKYGFYKHTHYWVQNGLLKQDVKNEMIRRGYEC